MPTTRRQLHQLSQTPSRLALQDDDDNEPPAVVTPSAPVKKKRRQAKTPSTSRSNNTKIKEPKDWRHIYELVEELRQDRTAPCDHSGCEALPDASQSPKVFRFQVLLSLMLSSQTKDAVVGAAIRKMQADRVCNVQAIHQMDADTLHQYIRSVGFHNNKTRYIKETVRILMEQYNGDIPFTATDMMEQLPGVGPKMAFICECVAWQRQSGIGVDTHMHRLFTKLQWVTNAKTPEQTRIQLQAWLPHSFWKDVNILWVGFGQELQQEPAKILKKALSCSRPGDAVRLLGQCGLNCLKVGKELCIEEEVRSALQEESG